MEQEESPSLLQEDRTFEDLKLHTFYLTYVGLTGSSSEWTIIICQKNLVSLSYQTLISLNSTLTNPFLNIWIKSFEYLDVRRNDFGSFLYDFQNAYEMYVVDYIMFQNVAGRFE